VGDALHGTESRFFRASMMLKDLVVRESDSLVAQQGAARNMLCQPTGQADARTHKSAFCKRGSVNVPFPPNRYMPGVDICSAANL